MADPISAAILAIGNAVNAAVYGLTGSTFIANTVTSLVMAGLTVGTPIAISAATAALLAPEVPKPESFHSPYRATRAPRISAYGTNKLSGPYLLYEAANGRAYDVIAFHDGRIAGIVNLWLNDDIVTVDGAGAVNSSTADDGRYAANSLTKRIYIFTRNGLPTETSFTTNVDFTPLGAGVWTADHRADGVATMLVQSRSVEKPDMSNTYPNGAPLGAVTANCLLTYDWREPGQDIADDDTWTCSHNPMVQLGDYLTSTHHGMRFSFAERILPALDEWTVAADICDEAVSLKAGGTQPRYRSSGPFQHISAPIEVIGKILETCDGWMTTRGDGCFVPKAGKYEAPTVTFTDKHVIDYAMQRFVEDEQATNVLLVSYTSPDHEYNEVETEAWRDEADIAERGIERSQPMPLSWVQYNSQARRLAKRKMSRLTADIRGTFTTTLYGLRGLGERYIRLQISEIAALNDLVIEITSAEIDLSTMRVTFNFVSADTNIDAWDPATEEGDGPGDDGRVPPVALEAPTISTITPQFVSSGAGDGVQLHIEGVGPDRDDLTWFIRTRVTGSTSWNNVAEITDTDPAANFEGDSGFVESVASLDVALGYQTGGVDTLWSATSTVDTTAAASPPGLPGGLSAVDNGSGTNGATVSWSNAANVTHARIYHGSTSDSFPGVGSGSDIAAAPGTAQSANYLLSPGSYNIWVVNKNAAGYGDPAGPATVTVV